MTVAAADSAAFSRLWLPSTRGPGLVAVCREMDVRFSITIRQHARLRNLIEAIPETDWTPIPYWMDGTADVAETTYRACLKSPSP